MLKKWGVLVLTVLSILSSSFAQDNCGLKFKGIYAIKLDEEHSAILRFYEDGTVLASTSVNDYFNVMTWFNTENKEMVLKGKYKIKKCVIRFEVEGASGDQEYEGTINGDKIDFELRDEKTKAKTKRTYTYFILGSGKEK